MSQPIFERELAHFNAEFTLTGDLVKSAEWLSPMSMRRLYRVLKAGYDGHTNVTEPLEELAAGDVYDIPKRNPTQK